MKYLSFLNGAYTTAPGLTSSLKAEGRERLVFQIDQQYQHYIDNKKLCRAEDISKYYVEYNLTPQARTCANRFIAAQLLTEYPQQFSGRATDAGLQLKNSVTGEEIISTDWTMAGSGYMSLFDALCSQVQEDVAVVQFSQEDYVAAVHLCAPNHWSPRDKVGKPFYAVHAPVPSMERTLQHYQKMLASVVASPHASMRFAWGIATDDRLNHHPEPPPGIDHAQWAGRRHHADSTWFVRSERQCLVGFPEANAFMFTIRTYHYPVDELTGFEKEKLLSALRSMSAESLRYKGLANSLPLLEQKLQAHR